MEIWREINGTNGKYAVSTEGNVKDLKKDRLLRKEITQRGYLRVDMMIGGVRVRGRIHRLVAEAFISNPDGLPQIDHINGDKMDNRVENLRWVDNLTNSRCKNATSESKPVLVTTCTGEVTYYESQTSAARALGVSRYSVMAACDGYQETAGGCKVEYARE